MCLTVDYDIALSFAGEDREYVEQVAGHLRRLGVSVFYDRYEEVDLWGKDLYEHLSDIYRNKARYTVLFVSASYAEKLWPRHERRSAQARAFRESREYILPARFDDTEVPGLPETVAYMDLNRYEPEKLAGAICEKLVRAGLSLPQTSVHSFATPLQPATLALVTVFVRDEEGNPISGAEVMLVAANGTQVTQVTDDSGATAFDVSKRRLLTVFCAHPQHAGHVSEDFDPVRDLRITLAAVPSVGSLVATRSWITIPGVRGRINPIHDSSNRLYVYTKNVAIDGGKPQPVRFDIGKPLHLEDVDGNEQFVTFLGVVADCFLIEHRRPQAKER